LPHEHQESRRSRRNGARSQRWSRIRAVAWSTDLTPTITPPASVLCRICGDTIFMTTGKPISGRSRPASSAVFATASSEFDLRKLRRCLAPRARVRALRCFCLCEIEYYANGTLVVGHTSWLCNAACTSDHLLRPKSCRCLAPHKTQLRQHLIGVLAQRGARVTCVTLSLILIRLPTVGACPGSDGLLPRLCRSPATTARGKLLHGQNRAARDVVLIQQFHGLGTLFW